MTTEGKSISHGSLNDFRDAAVSSLQVSPVHARFAGQKNLVDHTMPTTRKAVASRTYRREPQMLREVTCARLHYLGVEIDAQRNLAAKADRISAIHADDSRVEVWGVPTRRGPRRSQRCRAIVRPDPCRIDNRWPVKPSAIIFSGMNSAKFPINKNIFAMSVTVQN